MKYTGHAFTFMVNDIEVHLKIEHEPLDKPIECYLTIEGGEPFHVQDFKLKGDVRIENAKTKLD